MTDAVQISATQVNELRATTGAGLMDCKRALVESRGNVEAAIDLLRKKGLAGAAKRADRAMSDGLVAAVISPDAHSGAIVLVGCETDFVAKTDEFINFTRGVAAQILESPAPLAIDALLAQTYKPAKQSVKDSLAGLISKLGENMAVRGFGLHKGDSHALVEQYIHLGGKVGVMLNLTVGKPETAQNPVVKTLAKEICMHIAASAPVAINRGDIDPGLVAKEKEIAAEMAKGKPPVAVEKIVAGKLEKFYAQNCLLEQPFVKNPDIAIKTLVETVGKQAGDTITLKAFTRLQAGA